jgi:TatA/E family protein of Tat protein translocase
MPFNIHPAFLIVLLVIVLIIFGPGKLPELGGAAGRMMREFRKASSEITDDLKASAPEKEADKQVAADSSASPAAKPDSEKSA